MSYETNLGIYLNAYDQASSVIASVGSSLSQVDEVTQQVTASTNSMNNAYGDVNAIMQQAEDGTYTLTSATKEMSEAYNNANSQVAAINSQYANVDTSVKTTTQSFSSQVMQINSLALGGATLFMAFERVENSQVALDRANLNVQKSTNSLTTEQNAYNKAVAEYGSNSQQAIDAAARLATAQDALTVAQERVGVAQNNLNNSMIYAALAVVPSAIAVIGGLYSAYQKLPDAISNITSKLGNLDISTKTLAISTAAAVGAFAATYAILESIPEPMRQTAEVIAIIIGVVIAATVAVAAFYSVLSWGTAIPVILVGVGVAIAGVTAALAGASSAADAYSGSLSTLVATEIDFVAVENTRYQTDLTNLTAYWSLKLGLTKTALETIDSEINTYYNAQETAATTEYNTEVTAANAAYNQQLTDFKSYWSEKLGFQTTELTTVDSEINRYYNQQTSDLQTTYNQQVSDTNAFYDDLVASTMTGLNNIRATRQTDLDNLELNMLLQKTALEDAHDKGLISDADYQTQLNAINSTYNAARSDVSDHYRLQELEAEKAQTAAAVPIETARGDALSALATKEATGLAAIETQKNADLQAAQATYASITTTGQQWLNDTLATLANNLAADILAIENQKNTALALAYSQNEALTATHATKSLLAQEAADVQTQYETEHTNAQLLLTQETAYAQQEADAKAAALAQQSIWQDAWQGIASAFTDAWSVITGTTTTTTPTPTPPSTSAEKAARIALIQGQDAVFWNALQSGQITQAEYNAAMVFQNQQMALANAMQYGGVVTKPTLALIGEAGPEAVIPLSHGEGYGAVTNSFSININVEGSVDQRTLAVLKQELKNVVVEATSQAAPATQKRIRLGSSRFSG